MESLKVFEHGLKRLAAASSSAMLRRRSGSAPNLGQLRRVLLVRIDDRVGEALLLTPLFSALKRRAPPVEVHVLLHAKIARVLEGHPEVDRLIRYDARSVLEIRGSQYEAVVDCTNWTAPSTTSALV